MFGQRAPIHPRILGRRARRDDERGAVLVEFALVAPLLFLLIFATIDFGWVFGQNLDVKHGARDGARLAAVNYGASSDDQTGALVAEICERMDSNPDVYVHLSHNGAASGDLLTVRVTRPAETLTGFVDFALNGVELSSSVVARIERPATWLSTPGGVPCG